MATVTGAADRNWPMECGNPGAALSSLSMNSSESGQHHRTGRTSRWPVREGNGICCSTKEAYLLVIIGLSPVIWGWSREKLTSPIFWLQPFCKWQQIIHYFFLEFIFSVDVPGGLGVVLVSTLRSRFCRCSSPAVHVKRHLLTSRSFTTETLWRRGSSICRGEGKEGCIIRSGDTNGSMTKSSRQRDVWESHTGN